MHPPVSASGVSTTWSFTWNAVTSVSLPVSAFSCGMKLHPTCSHVTMASPTGGALPTPGISAVATELALDDGTWTDLSAPLRNRSFMRCACWVSFSSSQSRASCESCSFHRGNRVSAAHSQGPAGHVSEKRMPEWSSDSEAQLSNPQGRCVSKQTMKSAHGTSVLRESVTHCVCRCLPSSLPRGLEFLSLQQRQGIQQTERWTVVSSV